MTYALILAGGIGTRMCSELPKQFINLNNKPIIIHTINKFLNNENIDKIIIGITKDWIEYLDKLLNIYFSESELSRIFVYEGGKRRSDTLTNGCIYIKNNFSINDNDIILTHDAVRPFLSHEIINNNIDAVKKHDAINTVVNPIDTIVETFDGNKISGIPVRSNMRLGQSPQTFKLNKLYDILVSLNDEEKEMMTDACKAFILRNKDVFLVEGDIKNIKITTPLDLEISKVILKNMNL